jgi:hypothetical protein
MSYNGLGVLLEGMIEGMMLSCHHANGLVPLHNAMVEQSNAHLELYTASFSM